ncbi:MAG TPA: hypothetical protein VEA44_02685 [Caulobacter sp.]|nr:hypothetical protein [Caulobacter sp.]
MRMGAGILLAAALTLAPMAAQAQPLVSSWTAAEMKALAGGMGLTVAQVDKLDNGDPFLIVQAGGGTNFAIYGAACSGAGPVRCRGVSLIAYVAYDTPAKAKAAKARLAYPAVSITQDDARTLEITRYVVLDEGVHRKNLEANIRLFVAILQEALALR